MQNKELVSNNTSIARRTYAAPWASRVVSPHGLATGALCRSKREAGTARDPTRARWPSGADCSLQEGSANSARDEGWGGDRGAADLQCSSIYRGFVWFRARGVGRMASSACSRGGVTLKLEHRRRCLITRQDHEGATRLCASSMSDHCWLRRPPSGSCLRSATRSGSRPVPCRGRARASGRWRWGPVLRGATAPRDGPRTSDSLLPGLGGPRLASC